MTFRTTDSNPQASSNPSTGSSTTISTHKDNIKPVLQVSVGNSRALSSSVPTQSGQTGGAHNRPFLADPSNHSPGLFRKRKNTEQPNMSASGGKKRRVDLIDLDHPQGPIILHGFLNSDTNYQTDVQSGRPLSAGCSSTRTVQASLPTQEAPAPSPSMSVRTEFRSAFVLLAPRTLMPPGLTKSTSKSNTKTGSLSSHFIDLWSSEDEGPRPMDSSHSTGGQSGHERAQAPRCH